MIIGFISDLEELTFEKLTKHRKDVEDFRDSVINSIMHRFTDVELDEYAQLPLRNVSRYNIMLCQEYVVSAILDPRVKVEPFKG